MWFLTTPKWSRGYLSAGRDGQSIERCCRHQQGSRPCTSRAKWSFSKQTHKNTQTRAVLKSPLAGCPWKYSGICYTFQVLPGSQLLGILRRVDTFCLQCRGDRRRLRETMVQPSGAECNGRLSRAVQRWCAQGTVPALLEEVWTCLRPSYAFKGLAMLVQGSIIDQWTKTLSRYQFYISFCIVVFLHTSAAHMVKAKFIILEDTFLCRKPSPKGAIPF